MKTSLLSKRFSELREQWEKIEAAKQYMTSQFSVDGYRISDDDLINWEVKALNLLEMACRKDLSMSADSKNNKSHKAIG